MYSTLNTTERRCVSMFTLITQSELEHVFQFYECRLNMTSACPLLPSLRLWLAVAGAVTQVSV